MAVDDSTSPQDMFIPVDVGDHDYNLVYPANPNAGDLGNSTAVPDYGFKPVISDKPAADSNSSSSALITRNSSDKNANSSLSNNTGDELKPWEKKLKSNLTLSGPIDSYDFLNRTGPDYMALYDALHNIKGPKVNDKNALIYQRACRFAAVFIQHPEWRILDYINYVHKFYQNEEVIISIVVDAHNIALRNYAGKTKIAINYYLSMYGVYTYMLYYWCA